jgi:hypothetical protein
MAVLANPTVAPSTAFRRIPTDVPWEHPLENRTGTDREPGQGVVRAVYRPIRPGATCQIPTANSGRRGERFRLLRPTRPNLMPASIVGQRHARVTTHRALSRGRVEGTRATSA